MSERPVWSTVLPIVGAALLGVALVVAGGQWRSPVAQTPAPQAEALWKGEDPGCPVDFTTDDAERGIALAADWLLANQLPSGAFIESRDFGAGTVDEDVDPVHQAAALWGLSRLYRATEDPRAREALIRGLDYWKAAPPTNTEATAILAVAASQVDPAWRDQLLAVVQQAQLRDWRTRADVQDPDAQASSAADAAALLARVQAALDGRADLVEPAKPVWRATWLHDVAIPRKKRRDPLVTKELFPWAPLALRDLADSGWLDTEDAGDHLVQLSIWMIDDHQTLRRSGNTAYATVSLAAAANWARSARLPAGIKLQCATDRSLARLVSWQAGHPRAIDAIADAPDAPHISGGVSASAQASQQRLDYASYLLAALLEWRSGR